MDNTKTPLQKQLDRLKQNPLFQMSLGSKELFHSNFLAWILELKNQDEFISEFLKNLLSIDDKFVVSVVEAPKRERQNIDLLFTVKLNDDNKKKDGNEKLIIIENKVKSLPYRQQLKDYKEKIENKNEGTNIEFYLLSLVEPSKDVLPDEWNLIRYDEVANAINENLVSNECSSLITVKSMLVTYREYVSQLHEIAKNDFKVKNEDAFNPKEKRKDFEQVRLHDLYLKYRYQQVKDFIKANLEKQKIPVIEKKEELKSIENYPVLMLTNGFSKSNGKIDFKFIPFEYDKGVYFVFCLQLHGNQLRFALEYLNTEADKKDYSIILYQAAKKLYNDKKWMRKPLGVKMLDSISLDEEPSGKAQKSSVYDEERLFCKFGSAFVYKYYTIPDKTKVQDIVNLFTNTCTYLVEEKKEIINYLK